MTRSRTILCFGLLAAASFSWAQAWSDEYNRALGAIRGQKWEEARVAFKAAAALRKDDQSNATTIGPVTERRVWRNGAPYSPNFGAAYAGFKQAAALSDDAAKSALLKLVAEEFEGLLTRGQNSGETFYFLSSAYGILRDNAKIQDLQTRFESNKGKLNWKVDSEILTAEDTAAVATLMGTSSGNASAGTNPNGGTVVAPAAKIMDKFALIIGNSESRVANLSVPFASNDAVFLRDKLVQLAGYDEKNVDVVTNATASQMQAAAKALADRVSNEATVFIFFSGVGSNVDGKDYFAGVDTARLNDMTTMWAKSELYKLFSQKGCTIFAFYQCHRPVNAGRYFGQETPMVGSIAQTQATIQGGNVGGVVRNGQTVGLFTDAMVGVLAQMRTNRVPVMEFGWQVFDWMRGSRSPGSSGSGSPQTLTLPQLINLDPKTSGF